MVGHIGVIFKEAGNISSPYFTDLSSYIIPAEIAAQRFGGIIIAGGLS